MHGGGHSSRFWWVWNAQGSGATLATRFSDSHAARQGEREGHSVHSSAFIPACPRPARRQQAGLQSSPAHHAACWMAALQPAVSPQRSLTAHCACMVAAWKWPMLCMTPSNLPWLLHRVPAVSTTGAAWFTGQYAVPIQRPGSSLEESAPF